MWGKKNREIDEEMAFHREARTADLMRRGMSAEEAARTAQVEFGSTARYREEVRAAWGYRRWDEAMGDLRFAGRGMKKSPGFTLAALAILALAIGTNAVFFTLYLHYVVNPLPIRGAERHVMLRTYAEQGGPGGGFRRSEIEALRATGLVDGIYTSSALQVLMLKPTQRYVLAGTVSGNYFSLLGGQARVGRGLGEADAGHPVAVLSDSGWKRLFGADPAVMGKQVRVQQTTFTVVGVTAPGFTGAEAVVPDFWVTADQRSALWPREGAAPEEPRFMCYAVLAKGVSIERAGEAFTAVAKRFARPASERMGMVKVQKQTTLMGNGPDIDLASAFVFTAFLLVLLIACANLANLYLGRAAARTHEIGTRLSLGASRGRIVRQLLTESALTGTLGAGVGLALAVWGVRVSHDFLFSIAADFGIAMVDVSLDWRVAVFSAGLGVVAGILFGLLPALEVTAAGAAVATRREAASFGGRVRPRRMRNVLIGGQVAASLVLLILAGVLIRNVQQLNGRHPGYDLDHLYDLKQLAATPEVLRTMERVPGVVSVAATERVPLAGRFLSAPVTRGKERTTVFFGWVDHRYLPTMGLAVEGRNFTESEALQSARVAVVSAATAKRYWPGGRAVGQTLELDPLRDKREERPAGAYTVIGVVPDVINSWLFAGAEPTMVYVPAAAGAKANSVLVRLTGDMVTAVEKLREECLPFGGCVPSSLREMAGWQRFPFRAAAAVAMTLGAIALLLTAVGLYGVASYTVVQRRREIGVHMALGATPAQVMRRMLAEATWCVAGGVAVGLPVCLAVSKVTASSFFKIQTFDVGAYVTVPVLLAAIALLACLVPARRASLVDPMASLREE